MRGAAGFEKRVIIKTILPHLAEEEEFVEKFLDEGRIVVQLTHRNIVPVFDMGQEGGEYFIAMEYLPGRDLREILKRLQIDKRRMPVSLALMIVMEVCKGLAYAHRKVDDRGAPLELVHRDVSPSNILVSREGDVRIIDFGIARATGRSSRTASNTVSATCSALMRPDCTACRRAASRASSSSDLSCAALRSSSGRLRSESCIPVGTYAGQSTEVLTLSLRLARSWCRHSVKVTTACFDTQ
jgi:serine/threonine protein kinase